MGVSTPTAKEWVTLTFKVPRGTAARPSKAAWASSAASRRRRAWGKSVAPTSVRRKRLVERSMSTAPTVPSKRVSARLNEDLGSPSDRAAADRLGVLVIRTNARKSESSIMLLAFQNRNDAFNIRAGKRENGRICWAS